MFQADLEVFFWINGLAGKSALLDRLMLGVVGDFFIPVVMTLVLVALWFGARGPVERLANQRAVIDVVLAVGVTSLVVKMMNLAYFRPRPFADHAVNLIFYQPTDSSFPSNPAAVGFAIATAVWLGNRKAGSLLFGLALLWSFARVYVGVCYPLDVVVGALIGFFSSQLAFLVLRALGFLPRWLLSAARRLYLA